jgi:hypothetical protein
VENVENPGAVVIVEKDPNDVEEKEARGFKRMLLKGPMVAMASI